MSDYKSANDSTLAHSFDLDALMCLMSKLHASDAYVSAGAQVKFKINGEKVPVTDFPLTSDDITLLLSSLDSDQISILDQKKELNCVLSVSGVGRFRLSAFCQRNSKAIVIRYIPYDIPDLDSLGLPETLKEIALLKRGLALVVGPTGSGKSTTLAAILNHRNSLCSDHIITIEDPIEFLYRHKKSIVNQREIGVDAFSFDEALRNAMRQSPDVIMLGEIRDQQTMSLALHYAQSGHLCVATMHADNTYQAINRIVGFYDPSHREALFQELSSSLQAVIAQRLIPSLENKRIAATEILVSSTSIQDLISKGEIRKIPETMERSLAAGTTTFENQLIELVKDKRISVENALLFSDSASNLYWKLAKENLHLDSSAAKKAGVSEENIKRYESSLEKDPIAEQQKTHSFSSIEIDPTRL